MSLDENTKRFISRLSTDELIKIIEIEPPEYTKEEIDFIEEELSNRSYINGQNNPVAIVTPPHTNKKSHLDLLVALIIMFGIIIVIYRNTTTQDENKINNSKSSITDNQHSNEERQKKTAIKLVQKYTYGSNHQDTLIKTLAFRFNFHSYENIYEYKGWVAERSSEESEYIFRVHFYYTENTIERSISWAVDVKENKIVPLDEFAKSLMGIYY